MGPEDRTKKAYRGMAFRLIEMPTSIEVTRTYDTIVKQPKRRHGEKGTDTRGRK